MGSRRAARSAPWPPSITGLTALPRLAPRTSARAAAGVTTPAWAKDMISRTTARLEWAAQVRIAAMSTLRIGSPVMADKRSRTSGAFSAGVNVVISQCNESSIRPRPMATRPRSRLRARRLRRKAATPRTNRIGAAALTSKERTCAIRVVPTLAPSMTASAGTRSTSPPAANDVTISAVAVLLWRSVVTPSPARKAVMRLPSAVLSTRRRSDPKALTVPLCTM